MDGAALIVLFVVAWLVSGSGRRSDGIRSVAQRGPKPTPPPAPPRKQPDWRF